MADRDNDGDSAAPNVTEGVGEDRRTAERRDAPMDRRAFWRPTPDRRREATEQGRREQDSTRR